MKDLKVIKDIRSNSEGYLVVRENQIEEKKYCECYDRYGQVIGCYDAGCYSPENDSCDNWEDGDEEIHIETKTIEYWDGSNNRSFIVECDIEEAKDGELLEDSDPIAIKILKAFEKYDTYVEGSSKEEVIDGMTLRNSRSASCFELAEVIL